MSGDYKVVTQSVVNVDVTSDSTSFSKATRFAKDLTIIDLKAKLELVTGSLIQNMRLAVYNKENELVCQLNSDEALLGSFPVDDGMRIHVSDPTVKKGQYEDMSNVEKIEMSQEEYEKRGDSVRAFKQRMKMGQFREITPEEQQRMGEEQARKERAEKERVDKMKVGDRCEVSIPGQPARRGSVMFVGEVHFKPGLWVGVRYDEPLGKNDGSVEGKRYFECQPKYGGFTKPEKVEVGDFPELGLDFSDDEL